MGKKIAWSILIIASALVGFFAARARVTLDDSLSNINYDYNNALSSVDLSGIKVNSDKKIVNILFIGNDSRDDAAYSSEVGLTDTMIIGTMDMKHGALKLTSLMRDTVVDIPGHGKNKLNAAASFGGVKLLYKTIAKNFNIELDGYVEVGFGAFVKLVDKIGGVKLQLTESEASYLNRTNYIRKKKYRNVKAGKHTLNGHQALGYCRIRKGGVVTVNGLRDDYGRTWRQRAVINAVFNKIKKKSLSSWIGIANTVLKHVTTDLSSDQIIEYMKDAVYMGTTKISQLQIPYENYFRPATNGEYSCGSCLVMILEPGTTSWDTTTNSEILYRFIFKYNGNKEFKYR